MLMTGSTIVSLTGGQVRTEENSVMVFVAVHCIGIRVRSISRYRAIHSPKGGHNGRHERHLSGVHHST